MLTRDVFATAVASQYDLFANYVNGTYWRTRIKQNTGAMVTPGTLQAELIGGLTSLVNGVSSQFNMYAMLEAAGHVEVTKALEGSVEVNTRQIEHFGRQAASSALQLFRSASLQKISNVASLPSLELRMADSLGRSQDIRRLVWLQARQFAVDAHVVGQVIRLQELGHQVAKLHYPETEHRNEGIELSLDEVESWRREYFHPNSKALVTTYD